MAEINDKRFRELLHAYELGLLLTDDERREIELYLLEHDDLLEEAREFHAVIEQMRQNPEVRQSIGELAEGQTEETTGRVLRTTLRGKYFARLIPAATLLVIILLLVLKPWHIEVQTSREAVASANSIAVMYFQNLADIEDTERLGAITTNLLITDFSESDYIKVLSSQRLNDIMKLLGVEDTSQIDIDIATKIAQEANSRLLLLGTIIQVKPEIIITAQLIDVDSGIIKTSKKITSLPGEDIFSLVDRLSAEKRDNLFWPNSMERGPDPRVADITTHSKEAYRYYLDGIDYKYKWYSDEAERCFRQAVNLDSTFAMSYYYLSTYGTISEQIKMIKAAARYLDQVTKKEGYYIKSRLYWLQGDTLKAINELKLITDNYPQEKEAFYQLSVYKSSQGLYDESIKNARLAIQIDPLYKVAYNQLAYGFLNRGDYKEALSTIDKYIALAPEEANPYDSQGDIYLRMRKLDEAILSYERAIAIKPDFYNSLRMLARLYLTTGKFDKATAYLQRLVTSNYWVYQVSGMLGGAYVLIYQGKLEKALYSLDSCLTAILYQPEPTRNEIALAYAHFLKSKIYNEQGEYEQALKEIDQYIDCYKKTRPGDIVLHQYFRAFILAGSGDFEAASRYINQLKQDAESVDGNFYDYYMALGSVAYLKGDFLKAIEAFKKASNGLPDFQAFYLLGLSYLATNQPEKAVEVFESQEYIYSSWATYNCLWDAKMRYYLCCAFDDAKMYEKAKAYLKDFLWLWQDADSETQEIKDAQSRLSRLKEL